MRGQTISTGSPGSGTEVTAFRLLRAAGLDPEAESAARDWVRRSRRTR